MVAHLLPRTVYSLSIQKRLADESVWVVIQEDVRRSAAACEWLSDTESHLRQRSLFEDGDELADEPVAYTLEPLCQRGRESLACGDIAGLASARLMSLKYRFTGSNNYSVTLEAEDVLTGLEQTGESIPENAELVSAGIRLGLARVWCSERGDRSVSIYNYDGAELLAQEFLAARGFVIFTPNRWSILQVSEDATLMIQGGLNRG